MTLADKIWTQERTDVQWRPVSGSPFRFTVFRKYYGGVRGFATLPYGEVVAGEKPTQHKIMSRREVQEWAEKLEEQKPLPEPKGCE